MQGSKTANLDLPEHLKPFAYEMLTWCLRFQNDGFDAAAKLAEGWGPASHGLPDAIRSLKHEGI